MTLAGATQEEAARSIGLARTTVGRWRADWSDSRLAIRPRGRRAKRADRDQRSDLLHVLEHEGTGVGIPELKSRFPKIARRELESIRSRRASVLRRKRAESLFTLSWTRAGSVWATDFTQCPTPIDDDFRKLMLVRDLASGAQLTSLPCTGESAEEVRLVLEDLFAEHGAPLVIKEDNGPGFIAQATRELLAEHGVLVLYSPPYSPSYNGACEAGNGSIKCRATRIAAHAGRAGHWTADDVERARLQANACCRPLGPSGPTPDEIWSQRDPITDRERRAFHAAYRSFETAERSARNISELDTLERADQAMIDRAAIPAALKQLNLLEVRRG